MTWFYFSLLSIIALAGAELTQQHLLNSKSSINEKTSTFLTFFILALITTPFVIFGGLTDRLLEVFQDSILPYMLAANFIGAIAIGYYLKSLKVKNISISTIFVSLSVVVSTTIGIVFLNESAYLEKFLGIVLVLIAIVSLNIRNFFLEKNHLYGLLAGLMFGVTYSIDNFIVQDIPPLIYMFWAFLFVSLIGFLMNPREVLGELKRSKLIDFRPIVFSGIGYFFYNFFTFTAYTNGGEVGRVDAINNSQVFLIILVEYFVFKHTEGIKRKIFAALLAFTGVMILGYL